jgi:hypothetical protein
LAFVIGLFGIQSFVPNSAFPRSALGHSAFSRSVFRHRTKKILPKRSPVGRKFAQSGHPVPNPLAESQAFLLALLEACAFSPGLPDFSWCMIPKPGKMYQMIKKMYQMNKKCTKWS